MRLISIATALFFAATPVLAQNTADLARQYAEMPEVQAMFDDMLTPDVLARQFRLGLPSEIPVSDDQLDRIGGVMSEMMTSLRPELTEIMVDGMAQNFTAAELTALIAFYGSPDGASVMRKMQPMMQQIMGAFMPLMQRRQQDFLPQLIAILEE